MPHDSQTQAALRLAYGTIGRGALASSRVTTGWLHPIMVAVPSWVRMLTQGGHFPSHVVYVPTALGVLKQGGNAIDASVTLALCQGIMNPGASGVGGGLFATILAPDGRALVINGRDIAPAAANQTMFGANPTLSKRGGLSVAVPTELLGLHRAHELRGNLSWEQVVQPVIPLARCALWLAHQ